MGVIHCRQLYIRRDVVVIFLSQSNGCCIKRGTCGLYRIHPPCCLHGSALNTFPLFLTCHHKEYIKSCATIMNTVVLQSKETRCLMSGKAGRHTCRILPKLLKFLIKAEPARKINMFLNSATGNGNTSEYPPAA